MPGVIESMATINSVVRTGLAILAVALIGAGGWYGYQAFNASDLALKEKDRELASVRGELLQKRGEVKRHLGPIAGLNVDLEEKERKIKKLDLALRLLKVNHRVAWLTVVDQGIDPETKRLYTIGKFIEVNEKGEKIGEPKEFRIDGDVVYIDNWVVKFDDKYIEQAEIDRSTSLVLFRRIFGESQTPNDGIPLDAVGSRPQAYGSGDEISELEQKIWNDFWSIANDEAKAKALGIRAAHGEAPSMKLQKGKSYKIQLRASDGLSITPDSGPPPIIGKPAA